MNSKNGIIYKIDRNLDETNQSYDKRKWFISVYAPKNNKSLEKAIQLSNIWVNMLYLHCRYPENVEKEIEQIIKNSQNYNKFVKIRIKNMKAKLQ